jgi:hypothetical protein
MVTLILLIILFSAWRISRLVVWEPEISDETRPAFNLARGMAVAAYLVTIVLGCFWMASN